MVGGNGMEQGAERSEEEVKCERGSPLDHKLPL
jgi:hypothetical protein